MRRYACVLLLCLAIVGPGCGGGGGQATPTDSPPPELAFSAASIVGGALGSALQGLEGGAQGVEPDSPLAQYLFTASDLPPGFEMEDALGATSGELFGSKDFARRGALMRSAPGAGEAVVAVVADLKERDAVQGLLQSLESANVEEAQKEIASEFRADPGIPFRLAGMRFFQEPGVGEGGRGIVLQLNFNDSATATPVAMPSQAMIRMYIFGRGAVAVLAAEVQAGVDAATVPDDALELAVAKAIDARLPRD